MSTIYGHSLQGHPKDEWETLLEHSSAVALLAAQNADAFGFRDWGFIAGALHDIGKIAAMYQAYIAGEAASGGDHSLAGALLVQRDMKGWKAFLGPVIAGHHTGLQDVSVHVGRINGKKADIPASWERHVPALPDMTGWKPPFPFTGMPGPKGFGRSFLTRMLFSALVDAGAGRNNTAEYFVGNPDQSLAYAGAHRKRPRAEGPSYDRE